MRKKIRGKWDKLRGHTPTPEPEVGRPTSTPSTTTVTISISSPSVMESTPESTSSSHPGMSTNAPQVLPRSSPTSCAEIVVTETSPLSTGASPSGMSPDPQVTTTTELSSSTGVGSEGRPQTSKEGRSNIGDTVTGAVRLALDITESLSAGFPFLPGAVKALKTVVEVYEVWRLRPRACS